VSYLRIEPCLWRRQYQKCPGLHLREGSTLFRLFHQFAPLEVVRKPCRRVIPEVLVGLGRLKAVIYSSDRGQSGRPRTYVHFMEAPPMLASDRTGRQLYIVGGNYQVTKRGIEG